MRMCNMKKQRFPAHTQDCLQNCVFCNVIEFMLTQGYRNSLLFLKDVVFEYSKTFSNVTKWPPKLLKTKRSFRAVQKQKDFESSAFLMLSESSKPISTIIFMKNNDVDVKHNREHLWKTISFADFQTFKIYISVLKSSYEKLFIVFLNKKQLGNA